MLAWEGSAMRKIVLIVTILLAALGITSTAIAVTGATETSFPELDDRAALMALYNSTDGPNWTNNTGWGKGDPCDSAWYGVTCDTAVSYTHLTLPTTPYV